MCRTETAEDCDLGLGDSTCSSSESLITTTAEFRLSSFSNSNDETDKSDLHGETFDSTFKKSFAQVSRITSMVFTTVELRFTFTITSGSGVST